MIFYHLFLIILGLFDILRPSKQFFSHVETAIPYKEYRLNNLWDKGYHVEHHTNYNNSILLKM